jgi:hypothetical protein
VVEYQHPVGVGCLGDEAYGFRIIDAAQLILVIELPLIEGVGFARDSPLEEGVMSELVSVGKFPATSEFAGNFARFGYSVTLQLPEKVSDRRCLRGQFPKHPSREFLRLSREFNRAIRECCSGIRDLLSRSIIWLF